MIKSGAIILSLTLSSALAVAPANAADTYAAGNLRDVPFVSAGNWTGFYAGVNGGYGWSADNVQSDNNGGGKVPHPSGVIHLSPKGGFGGGQIGYNWQGGVFAPRVVLGVEADIQGAGIEDTAMLFPTREKAGLNWFGTVRSRIGYVFDTSMVYATGGLAFGEVDHEVSWFAPAQNTVTATGYVIGGGYEFKLSPAWSIKAEYQYVNLGRNELRNFNGFPIGNVVNSHGDVSQVRFDDDAYHTFRVGANYHLGSVYQPLK
jgi:outer membrane immunogenic protein